MSLTKKPSIVYRLGDNLYLNVTNKCSNDCYFCLRKVLKGVGGFNLKLSREPSTRQVISELEKVLNKRNWSESVFCGFGEPLKRLDCVSKVTEWIRKYHAKPIVVRIDTNGHGYLLNKGRRVLEDLKEAGVDKMSVSLNAHNEATYSQVCRPRFKDAFESVLGFVERAKEYFNVEVTAVTIPEVDISKVKEIAKEMGVKLRTRKLLPGF